MSDLAARIAEILRAHQWRKYEDRCRCDDPGTYDEYPAHLAALVAAAVEQHYRPAVERVRKLHYQQMSRSLDEDGNPDSYCDECGRGPYPCATIRALDGES